MNIQAAIVEEKAGAAQWKNLTLSGPKANEVLIKMVASGICHTDIGVQHQHIPTPLPIVLGHEGSGIIEEVGEGVTHFQKGDHVVISFSYCGHCRNCLEGHPAGCEQLFQLNFGGKMPDGTYRLCCDNKNVSTLFGQSSLSTYVVSHINNLVPVSKDVDLRLLGPMACGIQTGAGTVLNKLKPGFGQSIVIFGCGGVGLSAIMAAALTGCSEIIAVDLHVERLQLAKQLGATYTINGKDSNALEEIVKITDGGADFAIESTGVSQVVIQAVRCLRARGIVAVVGVSGDTTLNIHDDLIPPNRTIVGVVEGDVIPKLFIPKLIEYYQKGKFPFEKLITFYNQDQLDEAMNDMLSGKTIKPVIVF
jgi:aryl-alcohol dehydrogenase